MIITKTIALCQGFRRQFSLSSFINEKIFHKFSKFLKKRIRRKAISPYSLIIYNLKCVLRNFTPTLCDKA